MTMVKLKVLFQCTIQIGFYYSLYCALKKHVNFDVLTNILKHTYLIIILFIIVIISS